MSDLTLRANALTTTRAIFQPIPGLATSTRAASLPALSRVQAIEKTTGWDLRAWVDAAPTEAPDYVRLNAPAAEFTLGGGTNA